VFHPVLYLPLVEDTRARRCPVWMLPCPRAGSYLLDMPALPESPEGLPVYRTHLCRVKLMFDEVCEEIEAVLNGPVSHDVHVVAAGFSPASGAPEVSSAMAAARTWLASLKSLQFSPRDESRVLALSLPSALVVEVYVGTLVENFVTPKTKVLEVSRRDYHLVKWDTSGDSVDFEGSEDSDEDVGDTGDLEVGEAAEAAEAGPHLFGLQAYANACASRLHETSPVPLPVTMFCLGLADAALDESGACYGEVDGSQIVHCAGGDFTALELAALSEWLFVVRDDDLFQANL
jgi:hypothetical protein